jgi:hypothetical protein
MRPVRNQQDGVRPYSWPGWAVWMFLMLVMLVAGLVLVAGSVWGLRRHVTGPGIVILLGGIVTAGGALGCLPIFYRFRPRPEKPLPPAARRITVDLTLPVARDLAELQQRLALDEDDVVNQAIAMYQRVREQVTLGRQVVARDPRTGRELRMTTENRAT